MDKVEKYHVVEFDNHEQNLSFIDNLQQFLLTQEGLEFIRDSPPCMMLMSDSFPFKKHTTCPQGKPCVS